MSKGSLKRFNEIVMVFAKYGFGYIFDSKKSEDKKSPVNLRKAFEELGPTFIKIGQILSTRPEILGEEYSLELSKLQDNAPMESFEDINGVFYSNFHRNLKEEFYFINEKPLASASIAQVYTGILKDGREVVIKIQRPNIKKIMDIDFNILISISEKFKAIFKDIVIDPKEMILEIKKTTEKELDFIKEKDNIIRFKEFNESIKCIYAPYVVEELTLNEVITLENIEGFKITDIQAITDNGYEKEDIAKKFAISFFKQVIRDGFFHADPHPGNVLIRNGKICFIDFGMMGELSDEFRIKLKDVILGVATNDVDKLVDFIMAVGVKTGEVDSEILYEDIKYLYNRYINKSFKNIKISVLLQELLVVAKRNNLRFPSEFTMLIRSMIIVESIVTELSPEINIIELVTPYAKENAKDLLNEFSIEKSLVQFYRAWKFPEKLMELINELIKGRTKVSIKLDDNCKYLDQLNKMVNRLSFALIIAGMIVGSSIIINSNNGPKIHGTSIIGLVGYLASGVLGFWLIISIIRSGSLK